MADNPSFDREKYIRELKRVWRREQVSRRIYQALAEDERDANKRAILQKLAETEHTHGERWVRQLKAFGVPEPVYRDTLGDALWRWVLIQSGTENALARIESAEDEGTEIYAALMAAAPTEVDRQEIAGVLHDEQVHLGATAQIARPSAAP